MALRSNLNVWPSSANVFQSAALPAEFSSKPNPSTVMYILRQANGLQQLVSAQDVTNGMLGSCDTANDITIQNLSRLLTLPASNTTPNPNVVLSEPVTTFTVQDLCQALQPYTYLPSTMLYSARGPLDVHASRPGELPTLRTTRAMPMASPALLEQLPAAVLASLGELPQRSPYVRQEHIDVGVVKVLIQLCRENEVLALEELRLLQTADLSKVQNMPAYLNKRLNNRLWTSRKMHQVHHEPLTFLIR